MGPWGRRRCASSQGDMAFARKDPMSPVYAAKVPASMREFINDGTCTLTCCHVWAKQYGTWRDVLQSRRTGYSEEVEDTGRAKL